MSLILALLLTLFGLSLNKPPTILAQEANSTQAAEVETQVYIKPIDGLEVGLFGISPHQIVKALIEDNYQAYYAHSPSSVGIDIEGAYDRLQELGLVVELNPSENAGINQALDISSPLIFNDQRSLEVTDGNSYKDIDFTTYHGNSATIDKPFLKDTITASYYRQLSLQEQCSTQKTALKQVEVFCNKLSDPSECPLDTKIPHSNLSQRELLNEISSLDCKIFSNPEKLLTVSSEIRAALANVPLYQFNSYRLAFIVQVMKQDQATSLFQGFLGWFGLDKKDTVKVMTVIVPGPATESEAKDDPIEYHHLSRQLLTPLKDWDKEQEKEAEEKADRKSKSLAAVEAGFSEENLINCGNCNRGDDSDIKTALASIINGLEPSEYEDKAEKSELIQADANIRSENADYAYSSGETPLGSFVGGILESISTTFNSVIKLGTESKAEIESKQSEFRTYIITPADIDPTTVSQIFTPLEIQKTNQELNRPMTAAFNQGSNSSAHTGEGESASFEFYDPEKCNVDPDATTEGELDDSCTNSVSVTLGSFLQSIGHQVTGIARGSIEHLSSFVPHGNKIHEAFEATIYTPNSDTDFYLKGSEKAVEDQL